MKKLFLMLILSSALFADDTIVLNPGSVVIKKDTAVIILDPPPILDVKQKPKTSWTRIKDLFL